MKDSMTFTIRPKLTTAAREEIQYLLDSAMEVLKHTGIRVLHREALELLAGNGAYVSDGTLVRIPRKLVEQAVTSAPKELTIYDRNGHPWMHLGGGNLGGFRTYYGTGSDLTHTYDYRTGGLKLTVAEDIGNMAKCVDACPNIDFLMSYGIPSDVELPKVYHNEFFQMVSNSTKPIVFTSDNGQVSSEILDMASAVAGGKETLKENPFVINYAQPTSPLRHSGDALGKLFACCDYGVPVAYPPGLMPGASAPATAAGAVVQSLAEALSALVIHQLRTPGGPIVLCGAHGVMDMKTSINAYAAPERLKTEAVLASVYQYYGLPTWGFGGCTDATMLDEQAGMEFGMLTLWASLTGINLAHDTGYLASGMAGDLRAVVWNDEIIDNVRCLLLQGIPVDRDRAAVDCIHRVGPGGDYLGDDHTLRYFRSDMWEPAFLNRKSIPAWKDSGGETLPAKLTRRVREILENHEPAPLDKEAARYMKKYL